MIKKKLLNKRFILVAVFISSTLNSLCASDKDSEIGVLIKKAENIAENYIEKMINAPLGLLNGYGLYNNIEPMKDIHTLKDLMQKEKKSIENALLPILQRYIFLSYGYITCLQKKSYVNEQDDVKLTNYSTIIKTFYDSPETFNLYSEFLRDSDIKDAARSILPPLFILKLLSTPQQDLITNFLFNENSKSHNVEDTYNDYFIWAPLQVCHIPDFNDTILYQGLHLYNTRIMYENFKLLNNGCIKITNSTLHSNNLNVNNTLDSESSNFWIKNILLENVLVTDKFLNINTQCNIDRCSIMLHQASFTNTFKIGNFNTIINFLEIEDHVNKKIKIEMFNQQLIKHLDLTQNSYLNEIEFSENSKIESLALTLSHAVNLEKMLENIDANTLEKLSIEIKDPLLEKVDFGVSRFNNLKKFTFYFHGGLQEGKAHTILVPENLKDLDIQNKTPRNSKCVKSIINIKTISGKPLSLNSFIWSVSTSDFLFCDNNQDKHNIQGATLTHLNISFVNSDMCKQLGRDFRSSLESAYVSCNEHTNKELTDEYYNCKNKEAYYNPVFDFSGFEKLEGLKVLLRDENSTIKVPLSLKNLIIYPVRFETIKIDKENNIKSIEVTYAKSDEISVENIKTFLDHINKKTLQEVDLAFSSKKINNNDEVVDLADFHQLKKFKININPDQSIKIKNIPVDCRVEVVKGKVEIVENTDTNVDLNEEPKEKKNSAKGINNLYIKVTLLGIFSMFLAGILYQYYQKNILEKQQKI